MTLVLFVGVIAFSVAMMQQFVYHDYYFLDSHFVSLILLFIFLLSNLRHIKFKYEKHISLLILCVFSVTAISKAMNSQKKRKDNVQWETTSMKIRNFQSAAKLLADAKIPTDAKILVLDSGPPNLSFVFLNRKGFALMDTHRDNIIESLSWSFDYILIERDFFASEIYAFYPEIINQLEKVAENNFVILCTLNKQSLKAQSIEKFLLEGFQKVSYSYQEDFDSTLNSSLWEGLQIVKLEINDSNQVALITPDPNKFTVFRHQQQTDSLNNNSRLVFISFEISSSNYEAFHCSITWEDKGGMLFYRKFNISGMIQYEKKSKTIYLLSYLPESKTNEQLFTVYLQNLGSENYYLDNFSLRFIDL
jgi:hypothetical protein